MTPASVESGGVADVPADGAPSRGPQPALARRTHVAIAKPARLEADIEAETADDTRVDFGETGAGGVEPLLDRRIDDLQIERRVEPRRKHGVVVHLDRVVVVEAEVQLRAQERCEVRGEIGSRPADAEV